MTSFKEGRPKLNDLDCWELEGIRLETDTDVEIQVQDHWLKARVKYDEEDGQYLWLWLRKEPSPDMGQFAAVLEIHGEMKMRMAMKT